MKVEHDTRQAFWTSVQVNPPSHEQTVLMADELECAIESLLEITQQHIHTFDMHLLKTQRDRMSFIERHATIRVQAFTGVGHTTGVLDIMKANGLTYTYLTSKAFADTIKDAHPWRDLHCVDYMDSDCIIIDPASHASSRALSEAYRAGAEILLVKNRAPVIILVG